MAERARASAERRFDIERVGGAKYRRLYARLAAPASPGGSPAERGGATVARERGSEISFQTMEVLTLIPNRYGFAPGQRGSIELWEKVLAPEGIRLHWAPFESERLREILYTPGRTFEKAAEMARGYVERVKLLKRLDDYDAVFVYREAALLGPAFLEKRIARRKPIIYQLDDPLYVPYRSPSNGYLSYLKFFGKIADIIRLSKVVIVNSSHIREFAAQHNRNIWQVPSIVDTERYVYRPEPEHLERVTVGWSGSPTTVGNIRVVADALRELQHEG